MVQRDWPIDFGPAFGVAGTTQKLVVNPQCWFRGEKVIATDTGSTPGRGTRIMEILVGQRPQRPTSSGSTTVEFFPPNALGNGVRWDACEKALAIAITVSFVESCTFDMSVFGKAVI
jgi:hypothetical protein